LHLRLGDRIALAQLRVGLLRISAILLWRIRIVVHLLRIAGLSLLSFLLFFRSAPK
jgi:hypothetical protein